MKRKNPINAVSNVLIITTDSTTKKPIKRQLPNVLNHHNDSKEPDNKAPRHGNSAQNGSILCWGRGFSRRSGDCGRSDGRSWR
uniref:Uncharacterized protein n=1 Tax=Rhizophora mucronata TaxID=61149 RepID=A0A2P2IMU4_RHIMU